MRRLGAGELPQLRVSRSVGKSRARTDVFWFAPQSASWRHEAHGLLLGCRYAPYLSDVLGGSKAALSALVELTEDEDDAVRKYHRSFETDDGDMWFLPSALIGDPRRAPPRPSDALPIKYHVPEPEAVWFRLVSQRAAYLRGKAVLVWGRVFRPRRAQDATRLAAGSRNPGGDRRNRLCRCAPAKLFAGEGSNLPLCGFHRDNVPGDFAAMVDGGVRGTSRNIGMCGAVPALVWSSGSDTELMGDAGACALHGSKQPLSGVEEGIGQREISRED